jgi:hypothetical protein
MTCVGGPYVWVLTYVASSRAGCMSSCGCLCFMGLVCGVFGGFVVIEYVLDVFVLGLFCVVFMPLRFLGVGFIMVVSGHIGCGFPSFMFWFRGVSGDGTGVWALIGVVVVIGRVHEINWICVYYCSGVCIWVYILVCLGCFGFIFFVGEL